MCVLQQNNPDKCEMQILHKLAIGLMVYMPETSLSPAQSSGTLPAELRVSSLTVATFARHLKTHLFS